MEGFEARLWPGSLPLPGAAESGFHAHNGTVEGKILLNQNGVTFVLTDLDVGLTFMDVADTTHNAQTARRNDSNARTAYDTVVRLLEKLSPSDAERRVIEAKLAILKNRLQAVGQTF